jgi:signal transduction histidine kinase/CheY-like chemotaxis protein
VLGGEALSEGDQPVAGSDRKLRDIVALSTLPAMWLGADTPRVAESLAAALFSTIQPEVVFVALREHAHQAPVRVAQLDRYRTDDALAASLAPLVADWAREHNPDEFLPFSHPALGAPVQIAARALGFGGVHGVIAAGFRRPPDPTQHMMLAIGATQAAIAVQNATLLHSLRDSIAERERMEGVLREADRRKDEFIATLSHELRNPLAPLASSVQMLRLMSAQNPHLRAVHAVMERQMTQLVRLVDDLLEISRISTGTLELRRQPEDLVAVIRTALETSDPVIRNGAHEVRLSLPPEPLVVHGDRVRLAQILTNLLNNAAKYTPRGGVISVRAVAENGQAVVSVRDNGAGIQAALMGRLFEMFSRGDSNGSAAPGLGVGLALARRLVELHGGSISARSDGAGQGSQFEVRLPLTGASAAEPERATASADLAGQQILLIDDNVDAAESLAAVLRVLGAEVRVANDGRAALAAFRAAAPRVVVLDIGMPGMDGYEVAREIRRTEAGRRTRIIALTGWGQEEDRRRAHDVGIDHHLTKPADVDVLRSLLLR